MYNMFFSSFRVSLSISQNFTELDVWPLALNFILDVLFELYCLRFLARHAGKGVSSQGLPSGLLLDEAVRMVCVS